MHHVTLKLNAQASRRQLFNGRMHTIVPAVICVAGVLNGALVSANELAKSVPGWNGRAVPILHPMQDGKPISANYPDVLERTAGVVFNAKMDGDRLLAEFWIDEQRMDELGQTALLSALSAGSEVIEVSTGYFSDEETKAGVFNRVEYDRIQRNLVPDHVALLPGQIGACSIAHGCGVPRINSGADSVKKQLADALNSIGVALGLTTNCSCEEPMKTKADIIAHAKTLVANNKLDAKHLVVLEAASEEAAVAMAAMLAINTQAPAPAAPAAAAAPAVNAAAGALTAEQVQTMITNGVKEGIAALQTQLPALTERAQLTSEITANSANAFSAQELAAMSSESLAKYAKSLRPADYSGQGGGMPLQINEGATPLAAPAGLFGVPSTAKQ